MEIFIIILVIIILPGRNFTSQTDQKFTCQLGPEKQEEIIKIKMRQIPAKVLIKCDGVLQCSTHRAVLCPHMFLVLF